MVALLAAGVVVAGVVSVAVVCSSRLGLSLALIHLPLEEGANID